MAVITVRDLINELVKYDPRIEVQVEHKPIKNFELEKTEEENFVVERLIIKE